MIVALAFTVGSIVSFLGVVHGAARVAKRNGHHLP